VLVLQDAVVNPVVPASDLARARTFYEETLGIGAPVVEAEGGLVYGCRGTWFSLYQSMAAGTNEATAIEFVVDDLAAEMRSLRSRGVEFIEYDYPEFRTVDGVADAPEGKTAWFRDSEGNIVSLTQVSDPEMVGRLRSMLSG
jgi:predicted enzyme related to lactoylglutathione lyase